MLADDIAAAKRRAQIEEWDRGEAALATEVATKLQAPKVVLSDGEGAPLTVFVDWCRARSVRYCPARPFVVAAFLLAQAEAGGNAEDLLAPIRKLHASYGLADPTFAPIVGAALERVTTIKPPRSWPPEDKALFATLPAPIRLRIETRETQRDTELRRRQNEYAGMRERLKQQTETADSVFEKEKVTEKCHVI
jgi:hypothetical protein